MKPSLPHRRRNRRRARRPPVKTNMVDLDPSVKDVYGLPVSRVTYNHHPNDYRVAAFTIPRLEAIFTEMGAEKFQSVVPFAASTAIPQIPNMQHLQVGPGRSVPDPVGGSVNHQM